jgi:hypothetical protein
MSPAATPPSEQQEASATATATATATVRRREDVQHLRFIQYGT